jgi:hypothetical protein
LTSQEHEERRLRAGTKSSPRPPASLRR